jgi:superfamily II DNA or RNA helicase/HKD family nuclease
MPKPVRGLYETLVTESLNREISALPDSLHPNFLELDGAEAPDRIALHIARVIERYIGDRPKSDRASAGIALAQKIVDLISASHDGRDTSEERPLTPGRVLSAVFGLAPDGSPRVEQRPVTPLLDSVLLSNAPGEPSLGYQVKQEIASADRIDLIMAFIRKSGLKPLLGELERHCGDGRQLRVLTTVYTGTTEAHALDILRDLGAQVRVSYDTTGTRLHAKAWVFHRESGFSTAFIGSSNLTHQAQHSGLEWNVRISGARNPTLLEKISALFESYWHQGDFQTYNPAEFANAVQLVRQPQTTEFVLPPTEIELKPFQERLLEQIAIAREQGHHRNLLVAATGTGKTVMAAVDYVRLRAVLPRARLLFVAHRKEILKQAKGTFCHALRDPSFGELWVDSEVPQEFAYVFASIQSLAVNGLMSLGPNHFDVVVIDEFHHAAASSYRRLLEIVRPRELLGLTATPERSDGLSILDYFDGRIAAELRLWDAIDQQRLCPFSYYGIHDDVDLTKVAWRRGRGYDIDGLTNVLTADDARARFILQELSKHVDDVLQIRALGFCVSVAHARFMARVFNQYGVPSIAIWADTEERDRVQALRDLQDGRIRVLFSVDLFNEGVDIPAVDTLLMLRPTESATLFMQQLGRGLRRHGTKRICTVLDFVGQHRAEFRFDIKFCALFRVGRGTLERQITQDFPFLPAGCHFELQRKAKETVLASLKNSLPTSARDQAAALRVASSKGDCSLVEFLEEAGLVLEDVYKADGQCWSDLRERAGLAVLPAGPVEAELRKAIGRLLHIDDDLRISTYLALLQLDTPPDETALDEKTRRLLRMLVASVVTGKKATFPGMSLSDACVVLWKHPQVRAELMELLPLLKPRRQHQHRSLSSQPATPLFVHTRYTRVEIQAALNDGDRCHPPPWREGVRWLPDPKIDVAVFTLDKTSGRFSPTTRYRDFAIDTGHIHWESQSRTRADHPTGIRYRTHVAVGSEFFLFARESDDDRAFWFLGSATYVRHVGEAPMAITWKLPFPLPGDMFAAFAAAVA